MWIGSLFSGYHSQIRQEKDTRTYENGQHGDVQVPSEGEMGAASQRPPDYPV
jgi:hypothetical protein